MKPYLLFDRGVWWISPLKGEDADYFLWACCAPTVRDVCALWTRCLPNEYRAAAVSAATT